MCSCDNCRDGREDVAAALGMLLGPMLIGKRVSGRTWGFSYGRFEGVVLSVDDTVNIQCDNGNMEHVRFKGLEILNGG